MIDGNESRDISDYELGAGVPSRGGVKIDDVDVDVGRQVRVISEFCDYLYLSVPALWTDDERGLSPVAEANISRDSGGL